MARSAYQQELIGELLLLKKHAIKLHKDNIKTNYGLVISRVVTAIQDAILDIKETTP